MTNKSELGKKGEEFACEYLRENRYRILEQNYRQPWGELDIVAQTPDGTLVFVEVKTMNVESGRGLQPEDQLTAAKRIKTERAAALYAGRHPELIDVEKGWRIDLICLFYKEDSSDEKDLFEVKHYENI